jgi:hypothetical protein
MKVNIKSAEDGTVVIVLSPESPEDERELSKFRPPEVGEQPQVRLRPASSASRLSGE